MKIGVVGVVGCGVMGSGIAQICAMKGYGVAVCEVNGLILEKGMASIQKELFRLTKGTKLSTADAEKFMAEFKGVRLLTPLVPAIW